MVKVLMISCKKFDSMSVMAGARAKTKARMRYVIL